MGAGSVFPQQIIALGSRCMDLLDCEEPSTLKPRPDTLHSKPLYGPLAGSETPAADPVPIPRVFAVYSATGCFPAAAGVGHASGAPGPAAPALWLHYAGSPEFQAI